MNGLRNRARRGATLSRAAMVAALCGGVLSVVAVVTIVGGHAGGGVLGDPVWFDPGGRRRRR